MGKVKFFFSFVVFMLISFELSAQRIHGYACRGDLEKLDSLLNSGYDINVGNKYDFQRSLLHYAIGCRQPDILSYLIEKGINVNILDEEKRSPLFVAAKQNQTEFIKILIDAGAEANVIDKYGLTPLHFSVLQNNMAVTKILVEKGADLEVANNKGAVALEIAEREGWMEIYDYLIENGADKNKVRKHKVKGKYMGQKRPGLIPQMFAPNFISTETHIQNGIFHPNGKEFYFTKTGRGFREGRLMVSKRKGRRWTKPQQMTITGDYGAIDPFISIDGNQLFYCSNRPVIEGEPPQKHVDIWVLNREGKWWSEPIHLGNEVNDDEFDWFPSVSRKGTLYYSKQRKSNDILYAEFKNGKWQKGIVMSDSINSEKVDYDPYIAPDESYLIFASNRPGGYGSNDLYISFKNEDGTWSKAKNMGPEINSEYSEFTPGISPDGKYFFFSNSKAGVGDLYWVDAQIIENLR